MCARYDLVIEQALYERAFKTARLPKWNFPPRYNVAPTDQVPIVRVDPRRPARACLGAVGADSLLDARKAEVPA